ncbi:MAG: hypothetical protein ACREOU_11790 [Candidatus Eiseniibacteriota bacterium]
MAQWGAYGHGPGQFDNPEGVAVGPSGDIYVADFSGRIQRFSAEGAYLSG